MSIESPSTRPIVRNEKITICVPHEDQVEVSAKVAAATLGKVVDHSKVNIHLPTTPSETVKPSRVTIHLPPSAQKIPIFVTKSTIKYDLDDVCMKVAIASFEIKAGDPTALVGYRALSGEARPQIVLHLHPFSSRVRYSTEDGDEIALKDDQETDVMSLAADSVLQALHKADCVGKDVVLFQTRRGEHRKGGAKAIVSGFIEIVLKRDVASDAFLFKKGVISNAYAYLTERRLCLFLNDTTNETLTKIDSVLAKLFPRHNPLST